MTISRTLLALIGSFLGLVLTLPIVVLGIPFGIVGILTRLVYRLFEPKSVPWQQAIEFDPTVGWKPKANLHTHCSFAAGTFHFKTDAQGWRGKANLAESQVVVFGDSFAFGYGINESALFSELDPKLRIKPIGAPGYSMVQGLLWMRRLAPQLKGKLIVWFLCVANDLYDNLQPNMQSYRSPFLRKANGTGKWELVTNHLRMDRWPYNFEYDQPRVREQRYVGAFGSTVLSDRVYSACEFLLKEAANTCRLAGAELAVVTISSMAHFDELDWQRSISNLRDPKSLNADLPDRNISQICNKMNVPFVSTKSYLERGDHFPEDGHWNVRGHQRIADLLGSLYYRHLSKKARVMSMEANLVRPDEFVGQTETALHAEKI